MVRDVTTETELRVMQGRGNEPRDAGKLEEAKQQILP